MIALIAVLGAYAMTFTLLGNGLGWSPFGYMLAGVTGGLVVGVVIGYQRREVRDR